VHGEAAAGGDLDEPDQRAWRLEEILDSDTVERLAVIFCERLPIRLLPDCKSAGTWRLLPLV
jgi:hypothetical protein